jgi:Restriction endonuclease
VVQVKDWMNPVNQGELFKFKGVLDDLPGRPTGIVVTRSGYQKGAREFAHEHGILIYELREADCPPPLVLTTTGWARFWIIGTPLRGIIATKGETIPNLSGRSFAYDVFTPDFSNFRFDVSLGWFQSEHPTTDVNKIGELNMPPSLLHEINLYDQERTVIGNLATILQQVAEDVVEEGAEQKRATHVSSSPPSCGLILCRFRASRSTLFQLM